HAAHLVGVLGPGVSDHRLDDVRRQRHERRAGMFVQCTGHLRPATPAPGLPAAGVTCYLDIRTSGCLDASRGGAEEPYPGSSSSAPAASSSPGTSSATS